MSAVLSLSLLLLMPRLWSFSVPERVSVFGGEGGDALIAPKLTLRPDGTYRYQNLTGSCWIDWDDEGTWRYAGNLLILTSEESEEFWPVIVTSRNDESVLGVDVSIFEAGGAPIEGAVVSVGTPTSTYCSGYDGHVFIPLSDIAFSPRDARVITVVTNRNVVTTTASRDNVIAIQYMPCPHDVQWRRSYFMTTESGLAEIGGACARLLPLPSQQAAPYRKLRVPSRVTCGNPAVDTP